ncbi:T9SS type A sorting domain-containing protein [Hymenobacter sp. RP-2-7]|uniref:T9SS type A sorting domain-containing protein n=1 Tax=Hymenobacter polaris TaxID=2682546 RepID=A0A7Y0AGC7_9BACT|nr:T9SS type A sorting domain-containing protein [Hymenobacter polaris]NML66832.1 T9SS type A sorting domain-containing protein [Hymenobacter polaris]
MKQRLLTVICSLYALGLALAALPLTAQATPVHPLQAPARAFLDDRSLTVYPNPSTGIVHLTISGLEGRKVDVSVLNVIGTVVYRESLSELNDHFTKTLDLSRLANGLYYVKIEADNASQLCKLVIR